MAEDQQQLARKEPAYGATRIDLATVPNPGAITGRARIPVIGVQVIPNGPGYLFQNAAGQETRKRYLIVGAAADCDLRVDDPSVSAHHCSIVQRRDRVYVNDLGSTNGVWVAGYRVPSCELHAGTLVTIGSTNIAAVSRESLGRGIWITAATVPEFIHKAVAAYGSIRAAAEGIGVPYSTLRGWLEKK